jgi:hypothetical protein
MPPWSYSSLTKFETCPKQYQVIRVLKKVKEPPTEQTKWGEEVHLALEERVRDGKPLPDVMSKWENTAAKIAGIKGTVHCEHEFAFNFNLEPVGWWDESAWCRGIVDVWIDGGDKAIAYDYKTGKVKPDLDQLKLFAAFIMQSHPDVQVVSTGFIWLAHNKVTIETFTRKQVAGIWEEFIERSRRLQASYDQDRWVPKPSGLCQGWCPVGRANCDFWSPKRSK